MVSSSSRLLCVVNIDFIQQQKGMQPKRGVEKRNTEFSFVVACDF